MYRIGLILLFLGSPLSLAAEETEGKTIYRSEDEQGTPVFSDEASPGAEPVELGEPTTIDSRALSGPDYSIVFDTEERDAQAAQQRYTALEILSPPNDESIRANDGDVEVIFRIEPPAAPGHTIQLLLDGNVIREVATSSSVQLENLDRGAHSASLRVLDVDSGEQIQESQGHTFHVLRHSILQGQSGNANRGNRASAQ